MKKAIILNSGGMDSATVMAIAKNDGYFLYSLSFNYGQRQKQEIESAEKVARFFGTKKHLLLSIPLDRIGGSSLTDKRKKVPKYSSLKEIKSEIPSTYIPARNTIFLSFALAWGEVEGIFDIFIGVNSIDYSGYPDCRLEYIEKFQRLANLATRDGVRGKKIRIHAPLINMTKGEIIRKGMSLGVDYSLTWSCYDPTSTGKPCLKCPSCLLRKKGFIEEGIKDPLLKMINENKDE